MPLKTEMQRQKTTKKPAVLPINRNINYYSRYIVQSDISEVQCQWDRVCSTVSVRPCLKYSVSVWSTVSVRLCQWDSVWSTVSVRLCLKYSVSETVSAVQCQWDCVWSTVSVRLCLQYSVSETVSAVQCQWDCLKYSLCKLCIFLHRSLDDALLNIVILAA